MYFNVFAKYPLLLRLLLILSFLGQGIHLTKPQFILYYEHCGFKNSGKICIVNIHCTILGHLTSIWPYKYIKKIEIAF